MLEEGILKNSKLHALYFALIFPQVFDIAKFKSLVNYLEIKRHKKLKK